MGDEMFVVRWGNPNIQVYKCDADGGVNFQRNIDVAARSRAFRGLAACEFNQCLYVSEQCNRIYKVSAATNSTVGRWSVKGQPFGVTVNADHNLLVVCHESHKVQEYTTDGEMVLEIDLQPDILHPVHAVQLPSGEFGITCRGPVPGYCVVDSDGNVVKSTESGRMKRPSGFAVSKTGSKVFVADSGKHKILLLDFDSLSFEQLPAAFKLGFTRPYCVHFDQSAGVMHVGEWKGRERIFCFKI